MSENEKATYHAIDLGDGTAYVQRSAAHTATEDPLCAVERAVLRLLAERDQLRARVADLEAKDLDAAGRALVAGDAVENLASRCAELEAALKPSLDWMPIDTAPKDATEVILFYRDQYGNRCRIIGHWAQGGGEDQPVFGPAWFFRHGSAFCELSYKPTHWFPLTTPKSEANVKRLARLIAQDLFTTGCDNKPVDALRMYRGAGVHELYVGAWSEAAARERVEKLLREELADSD